MEKEGAYSSHLPFNIPVRILSNRLELTCKLFAVQYGDYEYGLLRSVKPGDLVVNFSKKETSNFIVLAICWFQVLFYRIACI